jgi:hypothetical protein
VECEPSLDTLKPVYVLNRFEDIVAEAKKKSAAKKPKAEKPEEAVDRTPLVQNDAHVVGGIEVPEGTTIMVGGVKHHPASVAEECFNTSGNGRGFGHPKPTGPPKTLPHPHRDDSGL